MTEPILTYVRGKGWVYERPVTMRCGTQVYLEFRKPKAGERATFNYEVSGFNWRTWAEGTSYRYVKVCTYDETADYDWCVLVPAS